MVVLKAKTLMSFQGRFINMFIRIKLTFSFLTAKAKEEITSLYSFLLLLGSYGKNCWLQDLSVTNHFLDLFHW